MIEPSVDPEQIADAATAFLAEAKAAGLVASREAGPTPGVPFLVPT